MTVSRIQEAILALNEIEFTALKQWIAELPAERDWDDRDAQIQTDSDEGNPDFLLVEAMSLDEARDLRGSGWEGDLDLMRSDGPEAS